MSSSTSPKHKGFILDTNVLSLFAKVNRLHLLQQFSKIPGEMAMHHTPRGERLRLGGCVFSKEWESVFYFFLKIARQPVGFAGIDRYSLLTFSAGSVR